MMSWQVRKMQAQDLQAVQLIETQVYDYPWSLAVFEDCLQQSHYLCHVVTEQPNVMAYSIVNEVLDEVHLLNIAVKPADQSQGVGHFLLQALIKHAVQTQKQRFLLEVRESNTIALKLYLSLGFREITTRLAYYPSPDGREDAKVLEYLIRDGER